MNKSLSNIAGLNVTLTPNGLEFGKDVLPPEFEEKRYSKWSKFFKAQDLDKDISLYYIYRNVSLSSDSAVLKTHAIRYDLTLIWPGKIGYEAMHTAGHFHKTSPNKNKYPEIYQVITGEALFLLQHPESRRFYTAKRGPGQYIMIPGECGHITVNASNEPLLVANVFSSTPNVTDYTTFKKHHGPAYYPISAQPITFQPNPAYDPAFELIHANTVSLPDTIPSSGSLYQNAVNNPHNFDLLNDPSTITPDELFSA